MRLTLTDNEYTEVKEALEQDNHLELVKMLERKKEEFEGSITDKKRGATVVANQSRIKASKEKVQNAINILRMEGKKINASTVAKMAEINYNTATKYLKEMNL
ncbi:MAG: hypothetical protein WC665_05605 [Sulfurimonas sp.]|jgi:hypothetical protein